MTGPRVHRLTVQVVALQPLASFWTSHRDPKFVLLEVIANGEPQEWVASDGPQIRTDERPSP